MAKSLIIVESPAKAKTIEKYLGKDYKVSSSYGHIRDLPDRELSIDLKNNYEPNYVISEEKEKVVKELKKLAKTCDEVILATDEDREGEAISWHLCHVLNLDPKKAKRITYTEITKKAIQKAIENPRTIDMDLVNAQQARRVLDRIVGYEVSPVLWKKVKTGLSAGRVQSVAVKLIVEREREITAFRTTSSFKISAEFNVIDKDGKKSKLKASSKKTFKDEAGAHQFLESCLGSEYNISNIEKKPGKKSPSAPFTTSTLQQEASRKIGYSVSKTMSVAQKLYEAGHITYMRTDSVNISDDAIKAAVAQIQTAYGKEYAEPRKYQSKQANAQEAHEAIRPTDFAVTRLDEDEDGARLYELIWKRAIASQMANAETEKTVMDIEIKSNKELLQASGEVVLFDGFLKVYTEDTDEENTEEEDSGLLPPLKKGDLLDLNRMLAVERFSRPPARYTEAALVKKLEELGIGRPSTYAPTISTIQRREYVLKKSTEGAERKYRILNLSGDKITAETMTERTGVEKNKLFPTDIGSVVCDFLGKHFTSIMDYGFTAEIEKEFDEIANGKIKWQKMMDSFYKPFHKDIVNTEEKAERASGERELGKHPESGENVIVRLGRYGPMAQIGKAEEGSDKKPRFAKLRADQSIETITLEEALALFTLPRSLGSYEGKEVKTSIGRFGPYVQYDKSFASITKDSGLDPYTITFDQAVEIIKAKAQADANKLIRDFPEIEAQVLNGRYGAYIKKGKENYKIPKDKVAAALSIEDVQQIIGEQAGKPKTKGRFGKKKK